MRRRFKKVLRGLGCGGLVLLALLVFVEVGTSGHGPSMLLFGHGRSSRQDTARLDIKNIQGGLELFFSKTGRFPKTEEGLQALVDAQILEAVPYDPWGRPYLYRLEEGRPVLVSLGEDAAPGGRGEAADVTSAELRPRH